MDIRKENQLRNNGKIRYRKSPKSSIYGAYIKDSADKGCIAVFGTVSDLSEKGIIFLDGRPANDNYIVLMKGRDSSSGELTNITACKDYVEMEYGLGE